MPKEKASPGPIPTSQSPPAVRAYIHSPIPQTPFNSTVILLAKLIPCLQSSENTSALPPLSVCHLNAFILVPAFTSEFGGGDQESFLFLHCCFQITLCHTYSPQSFCFIEEHDVQLHISLLLLTAVICHLPGVPSSLKLEGGGTGSWSFLLPSGFRGLVDDVTHTLTWTAPSSTYFHSCTSKTHCHTPWTLSLPNAALILKLIIQNSHYLIITFIFPACLQNNLHLYNTQSIKEQRMCASYRLGHSQKEDVGMNRTCLS